MLTTVPLTYPLLSTTSRTAITTPHDSDLDSTLRWAYQKENGHRERPSSSNLSNYDYDIAALTVIHPFYLRQ